MIELTKFRPVIRVNLEPDLLRIQQMVSLIFVIC